MEGDGDCGGDGDVAVSLGTTIMACSYGDGVVLGADSRTSTGTYVANRMADKIRYLADNVYVCGSGSAADSQNIAEYVRHYIQQHEMDLQKPVTVHVAAKLAQSISYNNKAKLQSAMIIAGWDAANGGTVWALPLGGTLLQQAYTTGGSGSSYIYGWCDHHWRAGMTREETKSFVVRAVSIAMAKDGSSGGSIRLVMIDKDGVKREIIPGDAVPVYFGEVGAKN